LRVTADVDEEDIPKVRVGQRALLKADAFPGRVLEGKVAQITPKGDPVQKTYRVRVGLPDDTPLMIGMTVEANIVVAERQDAVLVPARALREGTAFVLAGGRVEVRRVEAGAAGPTMVEARAGLEPGNAVVLDPPPGLGDGQAVRRKGEAPGGWLAALLKRWRG
jgi:RND family efflux transporter MFP subunit